MLVAFYGGYGDYSVFSIYSVYRGRWQEKAKGKLAKTKKCAEKSIV